MEKKKNRKAVKFEQISVEEINMMTDDDLKMKIDKLRNEIEKIRTRGDSHVQMEMDLCYLQREYQIREIRMRAHFDYQKKMAEEDRQEYLREQTLPDYKPEPAPRKMWM